MAGSDKRQRNGTPQSLVRWTDEEFNALAAKADKAGLAVAAFMRAAALGDAGPRAQRRPPADHKALRQILGAARARREQPEPDRPRPQRRRTPVTCRNCKDALDACVDIRDAIFEALGKKHGPVP